MSRRGCSAVQGCCLRPVCVSLYAAPPHYILFVHFIPPTPPLFSLTPFAQGSISGGIWWGGGGALVWGVLANSSFSKGQRSWGQGYHSPGVGRFRCCQKFVVFPFFFVIVFWGQFAGVEKMQSTYHIFHVCFLPSKSLYFAYFVHIHCTF